MRYGYGHGLHVEYDSGGEVVVKQWYFMGHEVDEGTYNLWSEKGPPAGVLPKAPPGAEERDKGNAPSPSDDSPRLGLPGRLGLGGCRAPGRARWCGWDGGTVA